jgi:hypothetical protein
MFAAAVAAEIGANVAAAAGVKRESWRAARRRVVAVAPFHEHDQRGRELAALVGEGVSRPTGARLVGKPFEHAFVAKALEPAREDVGSDPEAVLELLEALRAEDCVAEDQERPALADDLQRSGDRADLIRIVALEHRRIIADLLDTSQVSRVGCLA